MDLRRHRSDSQPSRPAVEADCPEEAPAGATVDVEAFYILRSLSRKAVNCARVQLRGREVLLDGFEGKPIAHLNLHHTPAQVVLFPAGEARCFQVNSVNDLYDFAEVVRSSIAWYEREFPFKPHVPEKEVMA
jgi:hypothetical protein